MSMLERRFDDAGTTATVAGRIGENEAGAGAASAARRIRLGLTGLAAIFLLVLVAAAGLRPTAVSAAADPQANQQAEPLAVLGVAPGAGPAALADTRVPPPRRPSAT